MLPLICFLVDVSTSNSSSRVPSSTTTRVSSGCVASISILLTMRFNSPRCREPRVRNLSARRALDEDDQCTVRRVNCAHVRGMGGRGWRWLGVVPKAQQFAFRPQALPVLRALRSCGVASAAAAGTFMPFRFCADDPKISDAVVERLGRFQELVDVSIVPNSRCAGGRGTHPRMGIGREGIHAWDEITP